MKEESKTKQSDGKHVIITDLKSFIENVKVSNTLLSSMTILELIT